MCVPDAFYLLSLPSSGLIHLCEDPFIGKSSVLLGRAEERLAKRSRFLATAIARGGNYQHLVLESIPDVGENLGEEGSGRRVSPEEEKDGRCHSRQAGRHLAWR